MIKTKSLLTLGTIVASSSAAIVLSCTPSGPTSIAKTKSLIPKQVSISDPNQQKKFENEFIDKYRFESESLDVQLSHIAREMFGFWFMFKKETTPWICFGPIRGKVSTSSLSGNLNDINSKITPYKMVWINNHPYFQFKIWSSVNHYLRYGNSMLVQGWYNEGLEKHFELVNKKLNYKKSIFGSASASDIVSGLESFVTQNQKTPGFRIPFVYKYRSVAFSKWVNTKSLISIPLSVLSLNMLDEAKLTFTKSAEWTRLKLWKGFLPVQIPHPLLKPREVFGALHPTVPFPW